MKNAADWVAKAQLECFGNLSQFQDQQKIYLHNFLLQVQADAFQHAAGLADESLKDVDVKGPGIFLRAHARAIWPGAQSPAGSPTLTAQDFGGKMPQPEPPQDKYVPESPESST